MRARTDRTAQAKQGLVRRWASAIAIAVAASTVASATPAAAADFFGSPAGTPLPTTIVGMAPTGTGAGYWLVAADGTVLPYGDAARAGSASGAPADRAVGLAPHRDGGYWVADAAGRVSAHGSAPALGSLSRRPNAPIVGIAATPDGQGFWLVGSDGGIFSFGSARFFGSTGGTRLNQPILGLAPTTSGAGYWLVAADGGIFSFGDASFFGSTGGIRLNKPVVGMSPAPGGRGYWLVASDGGVFAFGEAPFHGSTGGIALNRPVTGLAATPAGDGYWMVATDGGIFSFSSKKGTKKTSPTEPAPTAPASPTAPTTDSSLLFADSFDGHPTGRWYDGSTHGGWRGVYDGYGWNGIEDTSDGRVLAQRPQASTQLDETHGGMVITDQKFGDIDVTVRMKTVSALRTPTPNPWEVAWLGWHHQSDGRFYYFIPKPNGFELGKVDDSKVDPNGPACVWPEYANCKYDGAQRYLSTGSSPTFPTGRWYTVRVRQVGATMDVWVDGVKITSYTDSTNTYTSGAVALYNEDAHVRFDDVAVRKPT